MKHLTILVFLIISSSVVAQQLGTNGKPTRYKPGFTFVDNQGQTVKLVSWVKVGQNEYRWRTECRHPALPQQIYKAWTDDEWIDIATKKAFLNEQTQQIVYYDSVNIVPRQKKLN